ncbi:unnamed protein product, partial [Meganyctiphanes norvegica]
AIKMEPSVSSQMDQWDSSSQSYDDKVEQHVSESGAPGRACSSVVVPGQQPACSSGPHDAPAVVVTGDHHHHTHLHQMALHSEISQPTHLQDSSRIRSAFVEVSHVK